MKLFFGCFNDQMFVVLFGFKICILKFDLFFGLYDLGSILPLPCFDAIIVFNVYILFILVISTSLVKMTAMFGLVISRT